MKLRYETGIATLIQFIVLNMLAIAIVVVEIVSSCDGNGSECSTNVFLSPVVFLLKVGLYGAVAALGYYAQDRRSKRLARLLILVELFLIPFSLFNLMHDTDYLTKITSLLGVGFALWIAFIAFRLSRSHGGRIVRPQSERARRRQPPTLLS